MFLADAALQMMAAGGQGLGAPTGFDVEVSCSGGPAATGDTATLTWTDNLTAPGATVQVWRKLAGEGDFTMIDGGVQPGVEEYVDTPDTVEASYQIRHARDGQFSDFAGPEVVQIDTGCGGGGF